MGTRKLRVALLSGGISAEREISLKSGYQVSRALDKDRYEVVRYDPRDDLVRLARDSKTIDVALIILHGRFGEDGTIQGFLESLNVRYQGSGVLGSALAMNKILSKERYQHAGLPVAPYLVVEQGRNDDPNIITKHLSFPVVVKPESEGSSIGLSIAHTKDELRSALELAWRCDRRCLVEKYLEGIEITVGVLGNNELCALPLVEIIPMPPHKFFDYEAKYIPGRTEEICPARLSEKLTRKAQQYAIRAHKALYCRGYSRTDMIVTDDDIYVLETNTIPGMTETSLFPKAAAEAGYSFSALLDKLIELALE